MKGNKKSGHGTVMGGVKGHSTHLFGAGVGLMGPGRNEHVSKGLKHKAKTTPSGSHRRTTRGSSR